MIIEQAVNAFVDWTKTFVTPDWGKLITLIPFGLAILVFLYLTWTAFRWANAGPTRRGYRRQPRRPPAGVHMPGPSLAPLLAAFGAFCTVFGFAAGGPWLLVGGLVLTATLLYWGREAVREHDRLRVAEGDVRLLPGAIPAMTGPVPEGVHVAPPSFRPLLVAIAMTITVAAVVIGGTALLLGAVAIAVAGVGWLADARREWRATEAADRTGHLDAGPAPAWPTAALAVLMILVAVGLAMVALGGGSPGATAGGAGGGAASPGASAAPGSPGLSGAQGG